MIATSFTDSEGRFHPAITLNLADGRSKIIYRNTFDNEDAAAAFAQKIVDAAIAMMRSFQG